MKTHIRIARPTNNMNEAIKLFKEGLEFEIIASFENHDGFNGVMFGHDDLDYHIEVTEQIGHTVKISPTKEDLLVFYFKDKSEFEKYCKKLAELGIRRVKSINPYWDKNGITFEDFDGYRIVLQNNAWNR